MTCKITKKNANIQIFEPKVDFKLGIYKIKGL